MSTQEEYDVTYSKRALEVIDDMTKRYAFEDREETLNFALYILKRLREEGTITLKENTL